MATRLEDLLLSLVPQDGSAIGNGALKTAFADAVTAAGGAVTEETYWTTREVLIAQGKLVKGQGRGGSVRRAAGVQDAATLTLTQQSIPPAADQPQPKQPNLLPPAKRQQTTRRAAAADPDAKVIAYRHDQKRVNNPEVGMVTPESAPDDGKTRWAYDPHIDPALQFDPGRAQIEKLIDDALASGDTDTMRGALETLKRMSAPYLNWAGKAERTSFEVDTVSLHVHERMDPATILAAVRKRMRDQKPGSAQGDFFRAWFEEPLPYREAIEFYRHDRGWANRLITGDSLLVMNSLLKKEGMAGQVQMVYIDPPYGIKYGSNFQPFVGKRDVKDRSDADLTQEPEMIKAFRDTWELGLHSYLSYLRDRLLLAKELLRETGSVFVQISDENLHHAYELLSEVFGAENFVSVITVRKTGAVSSPDARLNSLGTIGDFIVWFARSKGEMKYSQLFLDKEESGAAAQQYRLSDAAGNYQSVSIESNGYAEAFHFPMLVDGIDYRPSATRHWSTTKTGIERVMSAGRVLRTPAKLRFKKYLGDFPVSPVANIWTDLMGASGLVYVVQTNDRIVERCMLMTTDPGDLAVDPTCGSGTTAFVAEKWGRRWITCDTSRVAVTLAKQRLATASYDYYELNYPHEGLRGGFIYKTVPHITLKSIANNPEIDEIWDAMQPAVEQALAALNDALQTTPPPPLKIAEGGRKGEVVDFAARGRSHKLPTGDMVPANALLEWEVPFDAPESWLPAARDALAAFHAARIARQRRMDASIAAHADQEVLYDQPTVSKTKLRITGPFTVEAVPYPTVLSLDEQAPASEPDQSIARAGESSRQHAWRDELLKTGIRGKGGQQLRFAALETLPDTRHLHCTGTLVDSGDRVVVSFGPEHAALEQRQVELAMREAGDLFPRPKMIVFCAFTFDPEAAKDIDATKGIVALKAQMNTDLLTEDLKKARSSNQSFWLMGQPDVEVRRLDDGRWQVEVHGFDYFDTVKGELVSGGKGKIAAWMLDTDYDERSLFPRQMFFPMAGDKDGWNKLRRDIKAELNEALIDKLHGTVSLPFEAGDHRKIAVKIIDDRGIESLKVISLEQGSQG